jgi:hypothetical protein
MGALSGVTSPGFSPFTATISAQDANYKLGEKNGRSCTETMIASCPER